MCVCVRERERERERDRERQRETERETETDTERDRERERERERAMRVCDSFSQHVCSHRHPLPTDPPETAEDAANKRAMLDMIERAEAAVDQTAVQSAVRLILLCSFVFVCSFFPLQFLLRKQPGSCCSIGWRRFAFLIVLFLFVFFHLILFFFPVLAVVSMFSKVSSRSP